MSEKINDGGPAFPVPELGISHFNDPGAYSGMTLRDYFAAKAMHIAYEHFCGAHENGFAGLAQFAYKYADSMLKARQP